VNPATGDTLGRRIDYLNPIIWLAGLALLFVLFDEWQRLRRRVKAIEDRLERLDHMRRDEGGRYPS